MHTCCDAGKKKTASWASIQTRGESRFCADTLDLYEAVGYAHRVEKEMPVSEVSDIAEGDGKDKRLHGSP